VNREEAERFAGSWVQAWNAHDLDLVLGHFSDEVLFTSPVAAQLLAGSDGVIRGKRALRKYWAEGLRLIPDLHFDVVGVYLGVGALVINYSNQKGALVSEVLLFEGDLVKEGYGTYLDAGTDPAGVTREG
jgi:hypothetical protein